MHGSRQYLAVALLAMVPSAFLCAFYLFPLTTMLVLSVWDRGFTAQYFEQTLGNAAYMHILGWTLQMAAVTSLLCLVLGYPVAYFMVQCSSRVRALILALIVLPFWTSSLVRAYAWITLLGRTGLVNQLLQTSGITNEPLQLIFNTFGLYVGTVQIMLPYMIFALFGTMRGIDMRLIRAAETLGASPLRAFVRVYVPLSMPGVVAGLTLVFMITLGFFITPAILGGLRDATFVMLIEKLMNELLNWHLASALSAMLLAVTLTLYWAFTQFVGSGGLPAGERGTRSYGAAVATDRLFDFVDRALGPFYRAMAGVAQKLRPEGASMFPNMGASIISVAAVLAVLMLIVPIVIIVVMSFSPGHNLEFPPSRVSLQWFVKYFTRTEWLAATINSFQIGAMAGLAATALALLTAMALSRLTAKFQAALLTLILSPMIVPAMVYAVAVYYYFASLGLVGTKLGVALAHTVLAMPPAILLILSALQNLDRDYDRAAASLGAGAFRRFVFVSFPLIRPAVLSAGLLAFLTSFDEVVVALFLSGSRAVTLPKKMYESVRFDTDPTIIAASTVLVGITIVILCLCALMQRDKMKAGVAAGHEI